MRKYPPFWTPALIDSASGWAGQNGAFCAAMPVMSHVLAGLLAARTQERGACFDRQACQDVGEPPLIRTGGHQRSVPSLGAGGRAHDVGGAGRGRVGRHLSVSVSSCVAGQPHDGNLAVGLLLVCAIAWGDRRDAGERVGPLLALQGLTADLEPLGAGLQPDVAGVLAMLKNQAGWRAAPPSA